MPDLPTDIPPAVNYVVTAILAVGSMITAAVTARKPKQIASRSETDAVTLLPCSCKDEIEDSEARVKERIAAMELRVLSQLEATHKHAQLIPNLRETVHGCAVAANLIPQLKEDVAVLVALERKK